MADVWYYAQNGQQAGPVSASQLQQLAKAGQIQATDLVWKEGLPQWVAAKSIKGLFPAQAEPIVAVPVEPAARPARRDDPDGQLPDRDRGRAPRRDYDEDDERPRRRPRGEYEEEEDDDRPRRRRPRDDQDEYEDDDRPRRRRRKAAGGWEALPTGAKIGIMLGGLVLIVLAIAIPVIIYMNTGGGAGGGPNTWTVTVAQGRTNDRIMRFEQGDILQIDATSTNRGGDVDIHLFNSTHPIPVAADISIGPDSHVQYVVPRTENYKIQVSNLGPGSNTTTVRVNVTKGQPIGGGNKVGGIKPLPPDGGMKNVGGNKPPFNGGGNNPPPNFGGGVAKVDKVWNDQLTDNDPFDTVRNNCRSKVYTYPMKAGTTYTINMQSMQIDSYLRLENPTGVRVAEDDDSGGNLNARIVYTCTQDGAYRIIATTFAPNTIGPFTLSVSSGLK